MNDTLLLFIFKYILHFFLGIGIVGERAFSIVFLFFENSPPAFVLAAF